MKPNKLKFHFLFVAILILGSCASTQNKGTSAIIGGEYSEENNSTSYFVVPGGRVDIPGKWKKTKYDAVSKHQFFTNIDSLSIAIGLTQFNKYEFNFDGSKKGNDFVDAFYDWESGFMVEQGLDTEIIETDRENNFIIYRLYGEIEKGKFDTFFLVGTKEENVSNFSMTKTNKWSESRQIDFLKKLFLTAQSSN
jgi:hypothetical protein